MSAFSVSDSVHEFDKPHFTNSMIVNQHVDVGLQISHFFKFHWREEKYVYVRQFPT